MDTLQVVSTHSSSKSSSRSASPSRPLLSPVQPMPSSRSVSPSISPTSTVLAVSPSVNKPFVRPNQPHMTVQKHSTDSKMQAVSTPSGKDGGHKSASATPQTGPSRRDTASNIVYTTPAARAVALHATSIGSQEAIGFGDDEIDSQLTPIAGAANGSSEILGTGGSEDISATPDLQKAKNAITRLTDKIMRIKDQITEEQNTRDDNVNEYLRLSVNADKQQLGRIKGMFEKKNQKSAQVIAVLQRKLENYNKKMRDMENMVAMASQAGSSRGSDSSSSHHHRQPREVLRDMGQGLKNVGGNIRDGITGFSGTVMSKPREFAHLIKNKFGSADNINSLGKSAFYTGIEESGGSEEDQNSQQSQRIHHGSATLPANAPSHQNSGGSTGARFPHGSEEGVSECSSATSESLPPPHQVNNASNVGDAGTTPQQTHHITSPRRQTNYHPDPSGSLDNIGRIIEEVNALREELNTLRADFDALKSNVLAEQQFTSQALLDERFRVERLEEQLNDLTELHQTEVENLKTQVADSEEKVQYQSEERLRDIHEMLEACQTKISKMEHQQHQHQQYVTLEGINNSNARAVVVKLINVVLTVLQVVLLLVATTAGIVMPFLKTRLRVLSTVLLIGGIVFVIKQWPEVRDVGDHIMRHIKQAVAGK
ncbi:transmembrane and coiled-coil domains protein 2 [Neocloeon triangulifer]|uniref:transmembrane and coiled-coil domains protein 2 n=1 Tax=Neocloeon triangulifer TaxID=2078957 RepID=UPI00286F4E0E|nr:transmembrane and coiled-coil domains protein 2 [Neocloeon triangulifer]